MSKILIQTDRFTFEAELNDSPTSQKLLDVLPLKGRANTWGDEVYFSIPVAAKLDPDATDQLPAGSLAFWPPGNAFCLIWGPTPASHAEEPRFASPVNPLGQITGDLAPLNQIQDGDTVSISLATSA